MISVINSVKESMFSLMLLYDAYTALRLGNRTLAVLGLTKGTSADENSVTTTAALLERSTHIIDKGSQNTCTVNQTNSWFSNRVSFSYRY